MKSEQILDSFRLTKTREIFFESFKSNVRKGYSYEKRENAKISLVEIANANANKSMKTSLN